jgi:hypothetical protein
MQYPFAAPARLLVTTVTPWVDSANSPLNTALIERRGLVGDAVPQFGSATIRQSYEVGAHRLR